LARNLKEIFKNTNKRQTESTNKIKNLILTKANKQTIFNQFNHHIMVMF